MEQKQTINDGTPAKTVSKPVDEDREEIIKSMTTG